MLNTVSLPRTKRKSNNC